MRAVALPAGYGRLLLHRQFASATEKSAMQPAYRFAPSPNGPLHLGHAYSAILNHELARRHGGRFLLRIEDIDQARCRPEFETAIYDDLHWLGLEWEQPVRRQSDRFDAYARAVAELQARGLIYPAFLSRLETSRIVAEFERSGEQWPRDPDGMPHYPDHDRKLSPAEAAARIAAGEAHTLRLDMNKAIAAAGPLSWRELGEGPHGERGIVPADPARWGDVVIARKEVPTSYHLAVVIDDADQDITEIVRGQDLFASTSVHRLLQKLLGLPEPVYRHHRLLLDEHGQKLSKSDGATGLGALREAGAAPADIRRLAGLDDPADFPA
jgi:glutamyl-Q tRNA(Asp) synthetase